MSWAIKIVGFFKVPNCFRSISFRSFLRGATVELESFRLERKSTGFERYVTLNGTNPVKRLKLTICPPRSGDLKFCLSLRNSSYIWSRGELAETPGALALEPFESFKSSESWKCWSQWNMWVAAGASSKAKGSPKRSNRIQSIGSHRKVSLGNISLTLILHLAS